MRRITRTGFAAIVSAGLLVAGLAGCAQAGDGNTTQPGAGSGASAAAEHGATSASPTPTPTPTPTPELQGALSGRNTQLALDAGFVAALRNLSITPGVVGAAKLSAAGVVTLPITGGSVTAFAASSGVTPALRGTIDHSGAGLSLTGGGKKVDLRNLVIDPAAGTISGDVTVDGTSAAKGAALFTLDTASFAPAVKSGTATVIEGATVSVSDAAATLLNTTFGTTRVTSGLKVGTAKLTLTTR